MRLFLAIAIPLVLREGLATAQARLRRELPGWRWARPEGVHLTLRFLGEVDGVSRAHDDAWRTAASSVPEFSVEVGGAGVFPERRRPRVLWVGVRESGTQGRLEALAASLESAARAAGFAPEDRPFRPHLTLARAAERGAPRVPPENAIGVLGSFRAADVRLYRSELLPSGARYTEIASYPLGRAEGS